MSNVSARLDLENQCLWLGQERVPLAPKAFLVLRQLALSAGRLVTKKELLDAVWPDAFAGDAVLTVTIKQLRDLLGDDARQPRQIETVHRRGYRLIGDLRCERNLPSGEATNEAPLPIGSITPQTPVPLGRDLPMQQLKDAWAESLHGRRQIVFVTGEPGIGKTTLVEAFVDSLRPTDGAAHKATTPSLLLGRGRCVEEYGSTEAYRPILEALEDIVRAPGSNTFSDALRRCAPTWLVQLPWLVREEDSARLQIDLRWSTRERMLREIATMLELASADTPIGLLLEDLHWSDPSTATLLSFLGQRRQPARLLILCTYRPVEVIVANHPLREVKQRLQTVARCVDVPLLYLTSTDISQLLESRLGGPVDDAVKRLVYRGSNGNPLFVTHLVDHLLAQNVLRKQDGVWQARTDSTHAEPPVPAGLSEVIEKSFLRLSTEENAVLEAASVCGWQFSTAAVTFCLESEILDVERICEGLARRGDALRSSGTMLLSNGQVCGRYAFVHALLQNVFYQRLAPSHRMQTHQRLAVWGEANAAGAAELAHHFSLAGTADAASKAISYAQQAADRAHRMFAYEEAVSHRQTVLRVVREHPSLHPEQVGDALANLAKAEQVAGHIARAEANFKEVARLARAQGNIHLLARAAIGIGHGYQRIGQPDPLLIELLEEAVQGLGSGDHPLRALALAHLDYALGSVPGTLSRRAQLANEALAMARRLDDIETLVWVMQYTRWAFRGPQRSEDWRAGIAEIEALLGRVVDTEQMLMLRYLQVTDLLELGAIPEVRRQLVTLVEHAEAAQLPLFLWMALRLRTALALLCGELEEAEGLAAETCRVGQLSDHPNVMQMYAAQMTLLRVEQGRLDEVEPLVRAAVEQNPNVPTWRMFLAYVLTELGDPKEARTIFDDVAHEDFADVPHDTTWFIFMAFAASTAYALGDRRRASVLYADLLPYRDRCTGVGSSMLSFGHLERYLGLLAAAAGQKIEAKTHFERALRENEEMGAWPWVVLAARDYAHWLTGGGKTTTKKAMTLLDDAVTTAKRVGMDGWVERLQAAAHKLS